MSENVVHLHKATDPPTPDTAPTLLTVVPDGPPARPVPKGMADAQTVRTALYSWAFNVSRRDQDPPDEVAAVLAWFERKSVPTSALADRMQVRAVLDALTKKLDGTTAARHRRHPRRRPSAGSGPSFTTPSATPLTPDA